jgi:hypothetical protein
MRKRASFSQSNFLLTSKIAQKEKWNPAAIGERQAELAGLAVAAWPLVVE